MGTTSNCVQRSCAWFWARGKKDIKSELGFYAQNQKKAHILREEVVSDPDCDYFGENKETAESTDFVSEDDGDYNGSDLCSEGTDLDVEDNLPFVCDICNKIFKTCL